MAPITALVTGASGAVGTALTTHLRAAGARVVPWDRQKVDPWNESDSVALLRDVRPDVVFSLAIASRPTGREDEGAFINERWPAALARQARDIGATFVHTSSVMVYTDDLAGPYTPATTPDAIDGYGRAKLNADVAVLEANPDARIARIGWQIGHSPGSNNMVDFLHSRHAEDGFVQVSGRFVPACSFLEDTADAITRVASADPGTYLLDGNRGWTLHEICSALRQMHGAEWDIRCDDSFVHDQRMIDDRVPVRSIGSRLGFGEPVSHVPEER